MVQRERLKSCKRVVIKVGTSTVTHSTGKINLLRMETLAREISDLQSSGRDVCLISSGAVGAGVGKINFPDRPKTLPEKQALAAIGQGRLVHMYEKFFSEYGKTVAQVLLTRDVFSNRLRYLNARHTLLTLFDFAVVPIINENDTVAVDEIKFGDNDTLSAMVSCLIDADLLIILSDIDGLFSDDPRINPEAHLLPVVEEVSQELLAHSRTKGSKHSSGGMFTKLAAARIVMTSGIPMIIANNKEPNILRRLLDGENLGTLFLPSGEPVQARKQWIAFGSTPHGRIVVDDGAAEAVRNRGKSLLPSGVVAVEGNFSRGEVVSIFDGSKVEIARGMVNFSSDEIAIIAGHHTDEIEALLGNTDYDEIVHRNNLALI
ncbi:MAG: glutamate 5-kinase [Aminobacterium sp.]|jgi:glutamate 5-kinase|uniref:glutamate 5-kinase n=1 Tax=unclassified Aminobacterium TaxID=2685012 RepID=UPI001BCEC4F9|nr:MULTISPECIES: glutamate 5-kinase [unclassified Aminobacterium]MDD2206623.1 glutamate 5-kinase [Aminobacterium sp.]MDD3426387.1 glutamate 5-kinase [Aminobacterium sp.]MDD3706813.1 glutamate 5-kinase [Aminobacterium sp.]MDD4228630.1 glutamate 5-kinase [Aminobacterium sp.]MDD4551558.1 glutamate 5-kinase [Aminobacterium sp.]